MSKQDLDDSDVGIVAQDVGSLDLSYGAVPLNYNNMNYSYSGGVDTITIDSSNMYSGNTITLPSATITNGGYTIGSTGSSGQFYTTGINGNNWNTITTTTPSVNISSDGIDMAAGTDIKVNGKSLKDFMNKMEERLAILVPNPAKLEQFEALKKAYEHYKLMESLCQESPKEEE
jgi:hypothetical protein